MDGSDIPRADRVIRSAAKRLAKDGEPATEIINALLVTGINAGIDATDQDQMVHFLERTVFDIRAGTPVIGVDRSRLIILEPDVTKPVGG